MTLKHLPKRSIFINSLNPSEKVAHLKKEIMNNRQSSVSSGLLFNTRSGVAGIDQLSTIGLSAEATLVPSFNHLLRLGTNFLRLETGTLSSENRVQFASGQTQQGNFHIESLSAVVPFIEYRYDNDHYFMEAGIGSTPISNEIDTSALTWFMKGGIDLAPLSISLKTSREAINETMLSYIGAKDPVDGTVWGRSMKTGYEVALKHQSDWSTSLTFNYSPKIEGINTISNKEAKASFYIGKNFLKGEQETFLLGPLVVYDSYNHSTNHFTMGSGGYFSPTSFLLTGLYGDYTYIYDNNSFINIKGNVALLNFTESSAPYFPLSSDVGETYPATSHSGVGFNIKALGGYKINQNLHTMGMIGFSKAPEYNSMFAGVSLLYYFDKDKEMTPNDYMRSYHAREMFQ
jgi:hypothetical protein